MASINVGEDDFTALAGGASAAQKCGDAKLAQALDKMARKTNAALSNEACRKMCGGFARVFPHKGLTWQEVPSTLS